MISKVECNRCSIPRIEIKIGNKKAEDDDQTATEKDIIEKIKKMTKCENKRLSSKVNEKCSVIKKKARIEIDDIVENDVDTIGVDAENEATKKENPEVKRMEANDTPVLVEAEVYDREATDSVVENEANDTLVEVEAENETMKHEKMKEVVDDKKVATNTEVNKFAKLTKVKCNTNTSTVELSQMNAQDESV